MVFLVTVKQLINLLGLALLMPTACYCLRTALVLLIYPIDANVRDLGVCWNDCFRRIFGYKRYESVKQSQFFVMSYHLTCCITFIDGNF